MFNNSVIEIVRQFNLGNTPKEYIDKYNKKIGLVNLNRLSCQNVISFNYNVKKNLVIIKLDTKKEWLEN